MSFKDLEHSQGCVYLPLDLEFQAFGSGYHLVHFLEHQLSLRFGLDSRSRLAFFHFNRQLNFLHFRVEEVFNAVLSTVKLNHLIAHEF